MEQIPISQQITENEILPHIPEKKIISITPIKKGEGRRVYLIATENSKYIAKKSKGEEIELTNEIMVYPKISSLNIPFPKMIYSSKTLIIENYISGHYLLDSDSPKVFKEIGAAVKKIHSLKTKNFGMMDSNLVGIYKDEKDSLNDIINLGDDIFKASGLENIDIQGTIENNINIFDSKTSVLLHGDLYDDNLLIENDELKAIIDFADAIAGPPERDLGLFYFEFEDDKLWDAFLEGYEHKINDKKFKMYAFIFGSIGVAKKYFNTTSLKYKKFLKIVKEVQS